MVFFPGAGGDDDGMLGLVELPHQFNGVGHRLHTAALVGMDQDAVQVEAETHGAGDSPVTGVTFLKSPWENVEKSTLW